MLIAKGGGVARKVAPIIQCFKEMYRARKTMKETDSALVRVVLQQEIDDKIREITREILILQERVGFKDECAKK